MQMSRMNLDGYNHHSRIVAHAPVLFPSSHKFTVLYPPKGCYSGFVYVSHFRLSSSWCAFAER